MVINENMTAIATDTNSSDDNKNISGTSNKNVKNKIK